MWLRKELQTICLKEFTIRHQLDLLQDNAYIRFNVLHLTELEFEADTEHKEWDTISAYCDWYWSNFVEYLKFFPEIYSFLVQKEFLSESHTLVQRYNFRLVLKHRVKTCATFLEICRSIAYRGIIRDSIAKCSNYKQIFCILSERSRYTDPPGFKLLALDNRISFIRGWLTKLVYNQQKHLSPSVLQLGALDVKSVQNRKIECEDNTISSESSQGVHLDTFTKVESPVVLRSLIPKVSELKKDLRFVRFKRKPYRLSEILQSQDSDSTSSSDSLWQSPFKRHNSNSAK